jgi:lysozyme family protein
MIENYKDSLAHVLKNEGGFAILAHDPGGATMEGITLETYREWKRNPHLTAEDLKAIPDQEVHDLYKELFWGKIRGDDLPKGIDYAVFDAAVNMGCGRAIKLLQEAAGTLPDGVLGLKTLYAISQADHKTLMADFTAIKITFYKSLKTFAYFGNGWLNRVSQVQIIADGMIA